jgi:hypothetical protein
LFFTDSEQEVRHVDVVRYTTSIAAIVLLIIAAILVILGVGNVAGVPILSAGQFAAGYLAAGNFALGVFSAGIFAAGIFSIGIFSIGIFSIGIFSIGIFSAAIYPLAIYAAHHYVRSRKQDLVDAWREREGQQGCAALTRRYGRSLKKRMSVAALDA